MRYFEDYCEVHLESNAAPYNWLFRSNEKIRIKFGVHLSNSPDYGQVAYELNDGCGYSAAERVTAQTETTQDGEFKMFSVTLPPISNGGGYRYRLSYVDSFGHEHTSKRSRILLVCDEAPRSLSTIPSEFLGYANAQPLYGIKPKLAMTPSPDNWKSRLFYSIIIDRFARSTDNPHNGLSFVPYDPASPHASHGGKIRGVIEKIPYLKSLGVGAIILSPIYVNDAQGYHGYHPIHLLMIDPRLGTLSCFRDLVKIAHESDIAVVLDVVNNHIADSINWSENGGSSSGEFKYIQGEDAAVMPFPIEIRNPELFHGPEYTDMVNQRLFGFLEDWRTETAYVRELLIQHLKYWIAETDIDGFRYDGARHVGLDFWETCVEEISKYASYLGKKQFLQIAEHAGSKHEEVITYNTAKFSGLIDYPTYYNVKHSLKDGNWLDGLANYFCGLLEPIPQYHHGWRNNLMFLDNQDTSRLFHQFWSRLKNRDEAQVRVHFALACLILGPQTPSIYQGTEQEFSGALGMHQCQDTENWLGHDCYVREDMFDNSDCTWQFGAINRKTFAPYSQEHTTFLLIRQLADIRSQNPVIINGERTILCSKNNGLWAVLIHHHRGYEQPIFVAMNIGAMALLDESVEIPEIYGNFYGVDTLTNTLETEFKIIKGIIEVKLPPFTFALGRLLCSK